jgi:hypothetical protein
MALTMRAHLSSFVFAFTFLWSCVDEDPSRTSTSRFRPFVRSLSENPRFHFRFKRAGTSLRFGRVVSSYAWALLEDSLSLRGTSPGALFIRVQSDIHVPL